jgi:hypothetical protein
MFLFFVHQHQQTTQNASTERERKTQNRISAPWMFVRRNSSKDKTAERPASVALPVINGSAKANGTLKTVATGADVEL